MLTYISKCIVITLIIKTYAQCYIVSAGVPVCKNCGYILWWQQISFQPRICKRRKQLSPARTLAHGTIVSVTNQVAFHGYVGHKKTHSRNVVPRSISRSAPDATEIEVTEPRATLYRRAQSLRHASTTHKRYVGM